MTICATSTSDNVMGYQFAHIESYSRAGSRSGGHTVADILAEARRSPESSLHVAQPRAPINVYGCDLEELERRHDHLIGSAKETLANGKTRAVRKDTSSLFAAVISHPATPQECRDDPAIKAAVESWARESTKWLRRDLEARGGTLETVILHVDESHVHLHAYGLHPSGHADKLHPGKTAKKDAVAAALDAGHDKKTANAFGDKAYVTAMRAWQDSYSREVGLPHGLTRLGPARRRLSRAEWQAEKAAAKSVQQARTLAKGATDAAKAAESVRDRILEEAQQNARLLALEGHRRVNEARRTEAAAAELEAQAKALLRDAGRQRDRILSRARTELNRLRSFGTIIRTLWDSFRHSSIREKLRQEMQWQLDRESEHTASATRKAQEEIRRRRDIEKRLADAIQSAISSGRERDEIRRERDRLLNAVSASSPENRLKFP